MRGLSALIGNKKPEKCIYDSEKLDSVGKPKSSAKQNKLS